MFVIVTYPAVGLSQGDGESIEDDEELGFFRSSRAISPQTYLSSLPAYPVRSSAFKHVFPRSRFMTKTRLTISSIERPPAHISAMCFFRDDMASF